MPGFNRTGPQGQGSRTGKGLGKCNPNNQKSDEQPDVNEYPKGLGKRFGHGIGRRLGKGMERGQGRRLGRGN